ncbi:hypothetical protein CK203_023839 [Vitis vinifera]|uniref:Uncharacterized protein n=1 Tax=Vitis vinifera TaxID=29760 RepID=A0A438JA67_VITVI|nr:hypothetical protein CK203_023839 [Vitis vinifera]
MRQETIEALQTELQKAKEKLEAIEELKTQSDGKDLRLLPRQSRGWNLAKKGPWTFEDCFADLPADSGKLVDSYVAGKIVQFKEQIATLEKREER